jgi:tetratricopeptide (TPR) repeat protein
VGTVEDEAPAVWIDELEYDDSLLVQEPEEVVEEDDAERKPSWQGEEIVVEWVGRQKGAVSPIQVEEAETLDEPSEAPPPDVPVEAEEAQAPVLPSVPVISEGLLFPQRVSGGKASLGLSLDRYDYPEQLMEPHWSECIAALESGSIGSLRSALNRLYEARLDAGFRNMPDYATLLIRRAYRLIDEGHLLEARLLAEAAHNLAPESYAVSASMSMLFMKGPRPGLGKYLQWRWISLKQKLNDFLWQFSTLGKIFSLALTALYLIFLALGFYFLGRYARVFLHYVRERLPVGPVGMAMVTALILATLGVLLLLPGPFWVTVFIGFLSGRFVRKWEKVCYSLFLLFWALSPWLFNHTICFFSPLSDATRSLEKCIQGEWNAEAEGALNAAVEKYPESADLQLTKALVQKRRGDYEEAARVLRKALLANPQAGRLWNNLGNLHAIQGDLKQAKAAYQKATLYGNGSAAPHYNLSQLLRREFAFLKGADEYQWARKIDTERVDYFTYIHSPNPNRFFMDEEPRKTALWQHAFYSDPETERAADQVWRSTAAGIPLRQVPWVFLALAGVYVALAARRRSGLEPFACSGCGQIVCGKCDLGAEVGGLCSPCYQALYQRENISKERRHGQIRKMARYQSRRSRRLLILNLLVPGLGFSLVEDTPKGVLILLGFVFVGLVVGFWSSILPVPVTVWETEASVLRMLCFVMPIALYGFIQHKFVTKIRARR